MKNDLIEKNQAETRAVAGKYLTFSIGRESFGIDVLKIREIIRLVDITAVPQAPDHVRGVINLRGKIIPVVDLRLRFGLPKADTTERTCIVVVQINQPSGMQSPMGVIVDGVEEVLNIAQTDIEQTPDFGAKLEADYILGMAKVKSKVKTLLDIDSVLSASVAPSLAAA
jgi:purine-binding chemotaxis protein CheW